VGKYDAYPGTMKLKKKIGMQKYEVVGCKAKYKTSHENSL
jgi:hypothetical protein